MPRTTEGMQKLELRTDDLVETLWVTPLGENRFRLENTPFYAYGLSYHDIVEATAQDDSPIWLYSRTIMKSGHRTIRVSTPGGTDVPQAVIERLNARGSFCEGTGHSYLCFDIPPEVDLDAIAAELLTWSTDTIIWEHADPR